MPFVKDIWARHGARGFSVIRNSVFVDRIINHKLTDREFRNFLINDIHYLNDFARAMFTLADRTHTPEHHRMHLISFGQEAEQERLALIKRYFDDTPPSEPPHDHADSYGKHLIDCAQNASYAEACAASLPCFLFFDELGKHLVEQINNIEAHPQRHWITSYCSAVSTDELDWQLDAENISQISKIVNEVALDGSPRLQNAMSERFVQSIEFEQKFFIAACPEITKVRVEESHVINAAF